MNVVLVEGLFAADDGLCLEIVAGRAGLHRRITAPRIQKPGLALTGFTQHTHPERLQVLGLTEIAYLDTLDSERRRFGLKALCESDQG